MVPTIPQVWIALAAVTILIEAMIGLAAKYGKKKSDPTFGELVGPLVMAITIPILFTILGVLYAAFNLPH